MLPMISPQDAERMLREGGARLIDVREPGELAEIRIPGAEAAPLSVLPWMRLEPAADGKAVIFTCRSGRRTTAASDRLEAAAGGPAWQLEGGVAAWIQAGLPVERGRKMIPVMRQVQIAAGLLVLAGLAGGLVQPALLWLSAFVGAGLVFAGVTGTCALGSLLAAMPWNRNQGMAGRSDERAA